MIVENGYIRFVIRHKALDDNGNPAETPAEYGNYIPACINGSFNVDGFSEEFGTHYTSSSYTIFIRLMELKSNYIEIFDRQKNKLDEGFIKAVQNLHIARETKLTIER